MEQRLRSKRKTVIGTYEVAEFDGTDYSGIDVVGDRVVIEPDRAAKVVNGLYVTDEKQEQITTAAETGVIVGVGDQAFKYNADRTRLWEGDNKPKLGERVIFERYAGMLVIGEDGRFYRVVDDKVIAGRTRAAPPRPADPEEEKEASLADLAAEAIGRSLNEVEHAEAEVLTTDSTANEAEIAEAERLAAEKRAKEMQAAAAAAVDLGAIARMVIDGDSFKTRMAIENPKANFHLITDRVRALIPGASRDDVVAACRDELEAFERRPAA